MRKAPELLFGLIISFALVVVGYTLGVARQATTTTDASASILLPFISGLVSSLAWPLVAVVVALSFRGSLARLFEGLDGLETPWGKASFKKEIKQASEEAKAIEPLSSSQTAPTTSGNFDAFDGCGCSFT